MKSTNNNSSNKHHNNRNFRIRPIPRKEPDLDKVADAVLLMNLVPTMIRTAAGLSADIDPDPVWEMLSDVDDEYRKQTLDNT